MNYWTEWGHTNSHPPSSLLEHHPSCSFDPGEWLYRGLSGLMVTAVEAVITQEAKWCARGSMVNEREEVRFESGSVPCICSLQVCFLFTCWCMLSMPGLEQSWGMTTTDFEYFDSRISKWSQRIDFALVTDFAGQCPGLLKPLPSPVSSLCSKEHLALSTSFCPYCSCPCLTLVIFYWDDFGSVQFCFFNPFST